MTKKSNKKKKISVLKIICTLVSIILLTCTISLITLLKLLNVIPNLYFIIGTFFISIITLIIIFFLLKKSKKKKQNKIIKIILILISVAIISVYLFGINYLNKTMNFFDNINSIKEEVSNYYVIVLKDSKYQEISDLYQKKIAYFNTTDKEVLNSIKLDLTFKELGEISQVKDALYKNEADAILISDIIKHKLEEDEPEFSEKTRILKTISISKEIEDITKKVTMKNTSFNVLISGIDTYGDINITTRNDVNIIATINPNSNEILLTSIPRDYYVQLHGTTGNKDKLTHASYYGTDIVVKTIEDILETDINYYVKVNFSTVVELVDELGGIEVYADQYMTRSSCTFKKGYNKVNGRCALVFSRERYSYADGDKHRGRNQQEVIQAIFRKVSSGTTIISEYTNILQVLDKKFATNIDMNEAMNFLKYELNDLTNYKFLTNQLDGYGSMGPTYSYPGQDLWIMIPYEESVKNAQNLIQETLNNK